MDFQMSLHCKEFASNDEIEKMRDAKITTTASSVRLFPVEILTEQDFRPRFCEDHGNLNRKMKAEVWLLHKFK